jgi:predicted PurR-regulated permease PerM
MIARTRDPVETRAWRARIIILALAVALVWACAPYLAGLLGAAVLAVVCAPAYRRWRGRLGDRTAALALTLAAAVLLVAPAVWLVATAIDEAPDALQRAVASTTFARLRTIQVGPFDVGAQIGRAGSDFIAWASPRALSLFGGLTRATLNLLLALVGLFYLLRSGNTVWAAVRPIIPFSRHGADALGERFVSVTEATLLGIAVTAASQGLVVGISFYLVGLPNALVWGVVTAMVSILPVLGSALVWGPGVVVLLANDRWGAALALLLIGVIVASNIDNVLLPMVYRRVSGLHPMATLVGAFSGIELLGFPGLLLGPLAIAYGLELIRLYQEEYGDPEPETCGVPRMTPREPSPRGLVARLDR